MTSLLELAADLERRDAELAAAIDRVARLADGAREIAARAQAIAALIDSAPAEHASLDRAGAEALAQSRAADDDLAAAATALDAASRKGHESVEVEREHRHAQLAARDAAARSERIACTRETLVTSERAARDDVQHLVADATRIAAELAGLSRVSASGRALPEASVDGLNDWAARVHAALIVVSGQLDVERDRLVREANELGSAVLGEQLAGSSVELVGKRVRAVLAG